MNQLEKTFQDMMKNCISCLDLYKTLWISNPIIAADVELLKNNNKAFDAAAIDQSNTGPEGQIAQKNLEIIELGKLIYKLDRILCHLANKTNNKVLLKTVKIPESKFVSGKEDKLLLRFEAILAAAREYLKDMNNYGITEANIDALAARLTKINNIPDAINIASSERKSATRIIKDLIKKARVILESLDDAIEGMIDDEKFIEAWFDARKIKGRHVNDKKEKDSGKGDVTSSK